jgi:hypothetical protein
MMVVLQTSVLLAMPVQMVQLDSMVKLVQWANTQIPTPPTPRLDA